MFEKLMYIEDGGDIASSIREMLEEEDLNLKAIVDLSAAKVLGDAGQDWSKQRGWRSLSKERRERRA